VVPKTVVVGHGIKSLAWPSLALTLATTLFALTLLWLLHTLVIVWRYARAAAEKPALSLFTMAHIYTCLSVLTIAIVIFVGVDLFGWEEFFSGTYTEARIGYYVVDIVLASAFLLAAGLSVLSYSAAAAFGAARWLPGTSQLIRSRTFPSMSFKGFIYKGLACAVISSVLSFSVYMLALYYIQFTGGSLSKALDNLLALGMLFSWGLVVPFSLASAAVLMLSLLRYTRKARLITEVRRTRTFSPVFAPLRDFRASLVQRASTLSPPVLYSAILFSVLYLVVFVAFNTLYFLVLPLLGEVHGDIKSETWLDECFVALVVFGALVSGVIMYRKDWKDLGRYEGALVSGGSWRHFLLGLLKSIGARSLRRGLLLSLVVAYVIALASAFLLAELHSPPLPKVEVIKLAQAENGQPGQEPAFRGKTLALLAHTEGYWYLVDEEESDLLVVPDRTDKFIRLRLDEQPK
jgi:hypothetical protein